MSLIIIKTEKTASFILLFTTIILFLSLWQLPSRKIVLLALFIAFVFLLIALYPKFGSYILIFSIPLLQPISLTSQYNANLLDIFLPIVIVSYCLRGVTLRKKLKIHGKKFLIPFGLYVFVCGLSLLKALLIMGSVSYIVQMLLNYIRLLESFFLFLIIVNTLDPKQNSKVLDAFLFLSALFSLAVIYKYQFVGNYSISTEHRLGLILVKPMEEMSNEGPNEAASVFLMCFGVTLNLIFSNFRKKIYYIYAAIFCYCVIVSLSRSAFAGFLAMVLYFVITTRKNRKIWLFLFTLLIIPYIMPQRFITKIDNTIHFRQASFDSATALTRLDSMHTSIMIWQENIGNLLLGIGYTGLKSPYFSPWGLTTSENFYIEALATTGLLGLGAFLYLIWVIFRGYLRFKHNALFKGFWISTIGMLVISIGGSSLHSLHVMNYFMVFLAFAYTSAKREAMLAQKKRKNGQNENRLYCW